MLKYYPDRYKAQEMCDKAIDAFLSTLKFVPYWFVMNKMLEKLDNVEFYNDDIDLDDIDSNNVTFFSDGIRLFTIDLNYINLDDDNFEEDDPGNIDLVRLITWHNRFKQCIKDY